MRVGVLTFQGRARGSQESGQGVRALFCLCGPQPCQTDEYRTLQTPQSGQAPTMAGCPEP